MRIGEAALAAGCQTETVRYYERSGLLRKAGRTESNYRQYTSEDVERLLFIRHARSLDMTLDEIRSLLDARDAPDKNCGTVNAVIDQHIVHITERISVLESLRKQLKQLRSRCQAAQTSKDCGILHELAHHEALHAPSVRAAAPSKSEGRSLSHGTRTSTRRGKR